VSDPGQDRKIDSRHSPSSLAKTPRINADVDVSSTSTT
jgi:hypothetical protein